MDSYSHSKNIASQLYAMRPVRILKLQGVLSAVYSLAASTISLFITRLLLTGLFIPSLFITSFFITSLGLAAPPTADDIDPEMKQALKAALSGAESFSDKFEAEVWLLQKATVLKKFVKDEKKRLHILKEVHKAASHAKLQPEIVLAVIEVESHFDRYAVSVAGAQGMMQVMPFWKKEIGREGDNLIDLKTNLRYGCAILKYYLDKEKGQWATALARYNGSYGKYWYPEKVMNAWQKHWR